MLEVNEEPNVVLWAARQEGNHVVSTGPIYGWLYSRDWKGR